MITLELSEKLRVWLYCFLDDWNNGLISARDELEDKKNVRELLYQMISQQLP